MKGTLYEILGVEPNATLEEITEKFEFLTVANHPDRFQGNFQRFQNEAEERFKNIQNAYDILKDPRKRAKYDKENGFCKSHGDETSNRNKTRSYSKSTQPYTKPHQYTPSQVPTEPYKPYTSEKPRKTVDSYPISQKKSAKDLGKLNIIKSLLVVGVVGGISGAITINLAVNGSGGTGEYLFIMFLYFFPGLLSYALTRRELLVVPAHLLGLLGYIIVDDPRWGALFLITGFVMTGFVIAITLFALRSIDIIKQLILVSIVGVTFIRIFNIFYFLEDVQLVIYIVFLIAGYITALIAAVLATKIRELVKI